MTQGKEKDLVLGSVFLRLGINKELLYYKMQNACPPKSKMEKSINSYVMSFAPSQKISNGALVTDSYVTMIRLESKSKMELR